MKQFLPTIIKYWKTIATVFSICTTVASVAWGMKVSIEKRAIEEYSGQIKQVNYESKIDKL